MLIFLKVFLINPIREIKKGLQNEQAFTKSKKVYYSIIEPSQAPSFTTLAEK